MGRDQRAWQRIGNLSSFNPRARVGRDVVDTAGVLVGGVFQSTRPRGARLFAESYRRERGTVSIHAPAWGATKSKREMADIQKVSIHAPAWGATLLAPNDPSSMEFQSTRPRGARLSPNWTNTNYSTKQSYIQVATKLTKITRPAVPQFRCQGTRANIVINRHHLPFARYRARQLAKPQGHKVSSHQNAPPFFANSSRGYIRAGYLLTHQ